MERGKLGTLVDCLSAAVDRLAERPEHSASRYTNRDAVNGAFGAFFFQFPSLLRYMREMRDKEKRENAKSLFDVKGIPSDNQIRNIVDVIDPSAIDSVFNDTLTATRQSGLTDEYLVLDKGVLLALDGLWYFSSEKIGCPHCLTRRTKDGKGNERTTHYHPSRRR